MTEEGARKRDYHFYGRRKGHALSQTQQALLGDLLPSLRIDVQCGLIMPLDLFDASRIGQVWLEIGFGGAEHLIWQARHNPDIGLIGVEPFVNGVVKALAGIKHEQLVNVRLYDDDVRDLLPLLADASIDRAFILFPDPWPKTRHRRRRIVSRELVAQLARILKPGGELRMASDIADYVDWMLRQVAHDSAFEWTATHAGSWRQRSADWPQTRYEGKAIREGRKPAYLRFIRRNL